MHNNRRRVGGAYEGLVGWTGVRTERGEELDGEGVLGEGARGVALVGIVEEGQEALRLS